MNSAAKQPRLAFRLLLDQKGGASEVSADSGAGPMWDHFRLGSDGTAYLVQTAKLDEQIAEALVIESARPRATPLRGGLLVVLRGVNLNPGADPEDMVSVRMWIEERRIVTVSPRRVMAIEDVEGLLEAGEGPRSAPETVVAIAGCLVERMAPVVDELLESVEDLQTKLLDHQTDDLQRELSDLRRTTALLHRHFAPQRDALIRLTKDYIGLLDETNVSALREIADRKMRYVEDLDSVRERATVIQDEIDHTAGQTLNRNMYVLSVVAAVFLPLSLLTGLLGINVGGIPGASSQSSFWIVTIALVVIAVFEVWFLRKRGMF